MKKENIFLILTEVGIVRPLRAGFRDGKWSDE